MKTKPNDNLYYEAIGGKRYCRRDYSRWDYHYQLTNRNLKKRFGASIIIRLYRAVKTTNERRQYEAALIEDIKPKIRSKRNPNNLPNSWNDVYVSLSSHAESWKTQRVRKQWMVNNKC